MADKISPQRRSFNMSRIRSRNTRPEVTVRKWLHSQGLRFRVHCQTLPARPDIVLPRFRAVVLVHGCFWHAHEDCCCFKIPASRTEWWLRKLGRNKARDWQQQRELELAGWRVFVVWECELKSARRAETLEKLRDGITQPDNDVPLCDLQADYSGYN
ncbi:DNA mismatch endonuclease Vsr [Hymenobacter sp. BT635]|uniref:Very short patch repair endonuclease n=1 Tax=Hymenobacter nitidus TaxID=2880929 RepID=A0ABS8AJY2_9BACT|nr:DNA mismatch endonuclease Vsr [Hymenobacter nitidus]MCB2380354.1 DNA mismatch endonuclease Vsr [Hymenobacter nitidus]